VTVGLSIGIGSVAGGLEPGDVYERVVREADDAMYADKTRRRHRR
jgi:GGDEF domain-containing protein